MLIQWLASSEHLDVPGRITLALEECALLRTLSTFSLHLYLGHNTAWGIMDEILKRARIRDEWETDMLMIFTYFACYLLATRLQPLLDAWTGQAKQ